MSVGTHMCECVNAFLCDCISNVIILTIAFMCVEVDSSYIAFICIFIAFSYCHIVTIHFFPLFQDYRK